MTKLNDMIFAIDSMDEIRAVHDMLKERARQIQSRKKFEFRVSDAVQFVAPSGMKYAGKIVKINPKTIKVKVEQGNVWNCSPSLLKKVG